ncbi:conserved hypothetical protein, partial [Trichinella spiralis]
MHKSWKFLMNSMANICQVLCLMA